MNIPPGPHPIIATVQDMLIEKELRIIWLTNSYYFLCVRMESGNKALLRGGSYVEVNIELRNSR